MPTPAAPSAWKICGLAILLAIMATVLTSCVTSGDHDGSLPWNAPASWDGQNLGVPLWVSRPSILIIIPLSMPPCRRKTSRSRQAAWLFSPMWTATSAAAVQP